MQSTGITSRREGGITDAAQLLGGVICICIAAIHFWSFAGGLLACGLLSYINIRINDICNALTTEKN